MTFGIFQINTTNYINTSFCKIHRNTKSLWLIIKDIQESQRPVSGTELPWLDSSDIGSICLFETRCLWLCYIKTTLVNYTPQTRYCNSFNSNCFNYILWWPLTKAIFRLGTQDRAENSCSNGQLCHPLNYCIQGNSLEALDAHGYEKGWKTSHSLSSPAPFCSSSSLLMVMMCNKVCSLMGRAHTEWLAVRVLFTRRATSIWTSVKHSA